MPLPPTPADSPQMGDSVHQLVRCWSCNGTGVGSLAILNTANKDIPCDRCAGTGECPEIMRDWEELGRFRKAIRLGHRLGIREWSKKLGCSVVDLSKAERGLIDPRTLPANS